MLQKVVSMTGRFAGSIGSSMAIVALAAASTPAAALETHATKGQVAELTIVKTTPVRWVELRLIGGIDIPKGAAALGEPRVRPSNVASSQLSRGVDRGFFSAL
jgi:hypothetical protein